MFSFDVTLCVQMFHFCIAWWMIYHYLLKFIIFEIRQDLSFLDDLKNKLQMIHDKVKIAEREKDEALKVFEEIYKKNIPTMINFHNSLKFNQKKSLEIKKMSDFEKQNLKNKIAQKIIERVVHDV